MKGLYAAVITPRTLDGQVDQNALHRLLQFLAGTGMEGFAVNGATGEFTRTTLAESEAAFEVAAEMTQKSFKFLAGIGSGSEDTTIRLGRLAERFGAEAVLLPSPYFFSYSQDDLQSTCEAVATRLEGPVLLYNLPQFSTGFAPETTLALVQSCPNIIGIKDSSGSLDTLRLLSRIGVQADKIVGNDSVIRAALLDGVCDGAISGVACVLPELVSRIFASRRAGDEDVEEFDRLCTILNGFIAQLDKLPTPWGLKALAEARGFGVPSFPLTAAPSRVEGVTAIQQWFDVHRETLLVM